jgi:DNA transformation protein and related proteins
VADFFFPDYVIEQLAAFGSVTSRPMFGGNGLFKGGVMFGLINDGELYFKVDDTSRADFEAKKSHPFTYEARGRKIALSYWFVPEDVIENAEDLQTWAGKAHAAAVKGRKAEGSRPKARRRALGQPPRRRR